MRSETDTFRQDDDESFYLKAEEMYGGEIEFRMEDRFDEICVNLTKDQAREFASQLLEMCEEE